MRHSLLILFVGILSLTSVLGFAIVISRNHVFFSSESASTVVSIFSLASTPSPLPTKSPPPSTLSELAPLFISIKAKDPINFQLAKDNNAQFLATSDNKSYIVFWKPDSWDNTLNKKIIISLHGRGTLATYDFALWYPFLKNRDIAILSIEWWGYSPDKTYEFIENSLLQSGVNKNDKVTLHGFSRGAVNTYALALLDKSGGNYFDYIFSNAGGIVPDLQANKDLLAGKDGEKPFEGVNWILYCGQKDLDVNLYGCPAVSNAKDKLLGWGANINLFIEDENGGHTGFFANEENVSKFLKVID